jgi:hypothetical protein
MKAYSFIYLSFGISLIVFGIVMTTGLYLKYQIDLASCEDVYCIQIVNNTIAITVSFLLLAVTGGIALMFTGRLLDKSIKERLS